MNSLAGAPPLGIPLLSKEEAAAEAIGLTAGMLAMQGSDNEDDEGGFDESEGVRKGKLSCCEG